MPLLSPAASPVSLSHRRLVSRRRFCYHDIMKSKHEKRSPRASQGVREPVQVYMAPGDRERLERLTDVLGTTKSDVLRRGLEALERQLLNPEHHPVLKIIGIAEEKAVREGGFDVAREHDRYLADLEDRRLEEGNHGS